MAEKTQGAAPAGVIQRVIKRAQQKALAKDAARILTGIHKAARGANCPLKAKKKKGKHGYPKAKKASAKQLLAKSAAGAIIALKSGTALQKRAGIVDLLTRLGGGVMRGAGRGVKGLGSALASLGARGATEGQPGRLSQLGKGISGAGRKLHTLGRGAAASLQPTGQTSPTAGKALKALLSAGPRGRLLAPAVGAGTLGAGGLGLGSAAKALVGAGGKKKPEGQAESKPKDEPKSQAAA